MAFYVGQEIQCIRDDWDPVPEYTGSIPVKGTVYHFAGYHTIDRDYLMLQEITFTYPCGAPAGYITTGFRPVTKTKTNISIFIAMLGPRQKETVDG